MAAETIKSRIDHVDWGLKCVATGNPGRFFLIDLRCSVTRSASFSHIQYITAFTYENVNNIG
ncbi:hypothetical protein HOLleu_34795 [Holothuria leucospilota]|uniref:Uncharacterized protein n=1 Tax=Holothuria leucospilota TaxID=206669 RepID=A0A9Q1BEH2_HOLLE|nr:hypothetical protein HOLleu_34795 [Holothuria leucospilota]